MIDRWYLSFVDNSGFLGACVVEASTWKVAIRNAWELGINPGGEVVLVLIPEHAYYNLPINRLMSRQELEEYGPTYRQGDRENPTQEIGLN